MTAAAAFELTAERAPLAAAIHSVELRAQHLLPNDIIRRGAVLYQIDYVAVSVAGIPIEIRAYPLDDQRQRIGVQVMFRLEFDELVRRIL